jgi:hypothetical protein
MTSRLESLEYSILGSESSSKTKLPNHLQEKHHVFDFEPKGGKRYSEEEKQVWWKTLRKKHGYWAFPKVRGRRVPEITEEAVDNAAEAYNAPPEIVKDIAEGMEGYVSGKLVFDSFETNADREAFNRGLGEHYELHSQTLENDQARPNNIVPPLSALDFGAEIVENTDPGLAEDLRNTAQKWTNRKLRDLIPGQTKEERVETIRNFTDDLLKSLKKFIRNPFGKRTKIT